MTIDDLKFSIKNHILNSISHRDLCTLCNIFAIPITARRKLNQKNVLDSILVSNDLTLLHHILFMLNKSEREVNAQIPTQMQPVVQNFSQNVIRLAQPQTANINFSLNLRLYCLSNELMKRSPIDLSSEIVSGVNPQNIFVPNYTKYPDGHFNAPSCAPVLINGRLNIPSAQLPYVSKYTTVKASPFYCCQVVLHPLSLLIPKPTPNIAQPNRVMSKMQLNFTISSSVRQLIMANICQNSNKSIYKWQILLRFGVYDPVKPFPSQGNDISTIAEYIPPYMSISVNGIPVQLWDILPSNTTVKEGKRHSRPINISEYIKYSQIDDRGYRQIINVNWWQTPGVYLYYYTGVFLERKLDVHELLSQFVKKTHTVQRPIAFTLDFIREKFSTNNQFNNKIFDGNDSDDDLIMSSVLPVSLLCPVGKSRITCPLRSINCQHLQCFDAHLYLMMNERRSVWKCPVCDGQATLTELFVDEYFQQILKDFDYDEEITEVNVNPDGSYIAVAVKESREDRKQNGTIISRVEKSFEPSESVNGSSHENSTESQPVILLESDEDKNSIELKYELLPSTILPLRCSSDVGSVKVTESIPISTSERNSCAIDLTSDSDDDTETVNSRGLSLISTQHIPQSPISTVASSSVLNSHNVATLSKLLPKVKQIQPQQINYKSRLIVENNKIANNTFQKLPLNCPLYIPNNGLPNMVWIPSTQKYPYLYPQEPTNKYITQSVFLNHPFSSSSNQSQPPTLIQKPVSPIAHSTVPPTPKVSPIKLSLKIDSYNDKRQLSHNNTPIKTQESISKKQKNKVVWEKEVVRRPRGSRCSTRIERQSRKKYFSYSDSDSSDTKRKLKRSNPFRDSESSDSDNSHIKRRRFVQEQSSEEDTCIKSIIIQKILKNLNFPIVSLTKLDEDVLKRYLKKFESDDVL